MVVFNTPSPIYSPYKHALGGLAIKKAPEGLESFLFGGLFLLGWDGDCCGSDVVVGDANVWGFVGHVVVCVVRCVRLKIM